MTTEIDIEFLEFKKKAELKKNYNKKYYLKIKENNVKKPKNELTLDEFKQLKEKKLLTNNKQIKALSKQELKDIIQKLENTIFELENKINNKSI